MQFDLEQSDIRRSNSVDTPGLRQRGRADFQKFCPGFVAQTAHGIVVKIRRYRQMFQPMKSNDFRRFPLQISVVFGFNQQFAPDTSAHRGIRQFRQEPRGEGQGSRVSPFCREGRIRPQFGQMLQQRPPGKFFVPATGQ